MAMVVMLNSKFQSCSPKTNEMCDVMVGLHLAKAELRTLQHIGKAFMFDCFYLRSLAAKLSRREDFKRPACLKVWIFPPTL